MESFVLPAILDPERTFETLYLVQPFHFRDEESKPQVDKSNVTSGKLNIGKQKSVEGCCKEIRLFMLGERKKPEYTRQIKDHLFN